MPTKSCVSFKYSIVLFLIDGKRGGCLLYHIVRQRVNRICVGFLLIVLTLLGSEPSEAQHRWTCSALSASKKNQKKKKTPNLMALRVVHVCMCGYNYMEDIIDHYGRRLSQPFIT